MRGVKIGSVRSAECRVEVLVRSAECRVEVLGLKRSDEQHSDCL